MNRFILFMCFWSSIATAAPLHVLIDPGHGGKDHGAVRGTVREADIALQVSHRLAELLKKNDNFRVNLTRDRDTTVSLNHRSEMAEQLNAGVLISIHVNSNEETHLSGPEFYFQSVLPADEYAQFLANRENRVEENDTVENKTETMAERLSIREDIENILRDLQHNYRIKLSGELVKALHYRWYGPSHSHLHTVKQAPFYVLTQSTAPSVLIELGYISNPQEAQMLAKASFQQQAAEHIYNALTSFKETLDKSRARRLN
jgi:N-acetylmuramoyl-L-alanine amidase